MNLNRWNGTDELAVGMYAMHHMHGGDRGTLTLVKDQVCEGRWSVEYVQITSSGDIHCGGCSSSWPTSDFRPISDPVLILAAEYYECNRQAAVSREHAESMKYQAGIRLCAIAAVKAAT